MKHCTVHLRKSTVSGQEVYIQWYHQEPWIITGICIDQNLQFMVKCFFSVLCNWSLQMVLWSLNVVNIQCHLSHVTSGIVQCICVNQQFRVKTCSYRWHRLQLLVIAQIRIDQRLQFVLKFVVWLLCHSAF